MPSPLLHATGQELDFVDLLSTSLSRAARYLLRIAVAACIVSLTAFPAAHAQVPSPFPSGQQGQSTDSTATPAPDTTGQYPSQPATQSQPFVRSTETNISQPRIVDRTTVPGQLRSPSGLSPLSLYPAPLSEFQKIVLESTGRRLPIFGANLFNQPPSTFAPVDNIPVTPDYVIGPGDEIRLQVWGQVNQRGTFIVDRTGSISLPQVGTLHVAGLQYSQLSDFIKSQLARVYRNFDLNVNLGQLRSIQVFVVGQARQPGTYTISSLSTLLNALFASGGPLPQGSLRDIQVKRGGKTVTRFDLYDLLLHGDKSKDIELASGDVIFIPPVGPQVAVVGSVTTPAIYELRGETTFKQVIAMAGGLTNGASDAPVQVQRIDDHSQRSMIDVDIDSGSSVVLQNGDIINVNSILQRFQNAVTLRGNVANPGRYVWHEGMRVSDLIPNRESLITRNYYERLNQLSQTPPEFPRLIDNTNPALPGYPYNSQAQSGPYYPQAANNSAYPRPSASGMPDNPANPSQMPNGAQQAGAAYGQDMNSAYNASGANPSEGALSLQERPGSAGANQRQGSNTSGGGSSAGEALTMSNGAFTPKNDVVLPAPDIDWQYAVIARQNQTDLKTTLLSFNLAKAVLDKDPSQDLQLLPGDVVTIFSKADIRVPSEQQTKIVRLEGEFVGAGIYSVQPGETLHHLLARAGGLTPQADLFASEFTRESVRRVEKERILEYADQLESQISANASASASTATSDRAAAAATQSAEAGRAIVARLRQAEPSGRIVLNLKPNSKGIDALPDLALQDGDRFIVPRVPATVNVEGQVYNANAFIYQPGKRVKDYLRLAGGPDRIGDSKREFVLRADGSVVSHQDASLGHRTLFATQSFDDVVLYPGDTIIVPPVISKTAILRNLSDIGTLLGGLGIAAAAIQVLAP